MEQLIPQNKGLLLLLLVLGGTCINDGVGLSEKYYSTHQEGVNIGWFLQKQFVSKLLGQVLIDTSFVLCSGHILGFIIFYGLGGLLFTLNIYMKEQCPYKKKDGWQECNKRSQRNSKRPCLLFIALIYFFAQQTFFYPFDQYLGWK